MFRTTSGDGSGTRPAYCTPISSCSGSPMSRHRALRPGGWPRRLRQLSNRSGSPDGEGPSSVCQYMVLADRKTSEVPPSLAASTARRMGTVQYSS